MEKTYSCYGHMCRRCLYQPQISGRFSKQPGVNIGCDDIRHSTGTTTPKGGEISHWIGQSTKKRGEEGQAVFTKRSRKKRVGSSNT